MALRAEQLPALLGKALREQRLPPLFVVASDEPLLAIEAQDAIRSTARTLGYTDREVLHAGARTDWSQLAAAAQGMSLFGDRKLLEIRLPTAAPGVAGSEALARHAELADDSLLTLVALPALDRRTRETKWAAALERHAVFIDIARVERAQLPAWIAQRLARHKLTAEPDALDFIAERVEGNLLAAHQEIGKLALLYPAGTLTLEQVRDSVLDVARYELPALQAAWLEGDSARLSRTLAGLQAEGEAMPLVLWSVTEELRALLRVQAAVGDGRPLAQALRDHRVWGTRERLYGTLVRQVSAARLQGLLARAAGIDRVSKGLHPREADSDPWLELHDLCLALHR